MKYKPGDVLTVISTDEHFQLLWTVLDSYMRIGSCINILKTKGVVKEFNDIRGDWINAMLVAYPDLKKYRYSMGSLGGDVVPFQSTLKIIITGVIK